MGRGIRLIDNESGILAITARTIHGRFLMRPDKKANDIILGVLGRAQALFGVEIYAFVFMSNHFHLMVRVRCVHQLSAFMCYLDGNLGKELGRYYGWPQGLWGRRFFSQSIGDSDASQMSWFLYILANGCKEGLVSSPLDWPGVSSAKALYHGESTLAGTWFNRTKQGEARRQQKGDVEFPSPEVVRLTPPPFLADRSPKAQRQFVIDAIRRIEAETAQRHRQEKTEPLGPRAIRRQKPHDKPKHFEPSPASVFHAATLADFWPMFYARLTKVVAYYAAAAKLKRGEWDFVFPEDCHRPPLPRGRPPTPS